MKLLQKYCDEVCDNHRPNAHPCLDSAACTINRGRETEAADLCETSLGPMREPYCFGGQTFASSAVATSCFGSPLRIPTGPSWIF